MQVTKKNVQDTAGALQACAGQDAGTEAAIHTMHDLFQDYEIEAVLLINAENNLK